MLELEKKNMVSEKRNMLVEHIRSFYYLTLNIFRLSSIVSKEDIFNAVKSIKIKEGCICCPLEIDSDLIINNIPVRNIIEIVCSPCFNNKIIPLFSKEEEILFGDHADFLIKNHKAIEKFPRF